MQSTLQNFADRFSGISSNRIRVEVQGAKDGLTPGSTVSFTLPSSAIVNLKTVALNGKFRCDGTPNSYPRIGSLSSIFERVECSVGGVCVSPGNYWGVCKSLHDTHTGQRSDLVHSHGIHATEKSYMQDHSVASDNESFYFSFSDWSHGFLAASPTYLDTSLMGPITIRCTLAPLSVICRDLISPPSGVTAAGTVTSYQLNKLFVDMEVLSVANPSYSAMQAAVIQASGYLPIPFKENYCVRVAHNGTSRASVSSRSIDRVITGIRPAINETRQFSMPVEPNGLGTDADKYTKQLECKKSPVDNWGSITTTGAGTNADPVITLDGFYSFDAEAHYSFGGSRFPQYNARYGVEILKISDDAIYEDEKMKRLEQPTGQSRRSNGVFAARLNLAGSSSPVVASGVDSRGQSLIIEYCTGGGSTPVPPTGEAIAYLMTECTSLVMVGPDRSVSLAR